MAVSVTVKDTLPPLGVYFNANNTQAEELTKLVNLIKSTTNEIKQHHSIIIAGDFNIDPDNLTRGAGARRAATATVVEGETATETQSGDASLRDVPLTDDSFAIDPTTGMPVRSSDGNTDAAASVGFFRVLEGGLGGPTIVPVPPPSFVSNMGPFREL